MQVLTGNIRAAVSIMAKPWAEGHVARISPTMLYGQETMRCKDANQKHQNLCIMTKEEFHGLFQQIPSTEHIELK